MYESPADLPMHLQIFEARAPWSLLTHGWLYLASQVAVNVCQSPTLKDFRRAVCQIGQTEGLEGHVGIINLRKSLSNKKCSSMGDIERHFRQKMTLN